MEAIEIPKCDHCGKEMEYSKFLDNIPSYTNPPFQCKDSVCQKERNGIEDKKRKQREEEEHDLYLKELPGKVEENPQKHLRDTEIPAKYINASLNTFIGGKNIIKASKDYLLNPTSSLLLTGKCGSGKTHIACGILREMVKINLSHVKFKSVPNLLLNLRSSFKQYPEQTEDEIIREYTQYSLIVLDDFGAEKSSEFSIASLYLILDKRINREYPTIITTNLNLKQIENVFGARISSRLSEFKLWNFDLPDYRKK